jgi:SPP1 gp7 family putative phage head morphogenesis protein
MSYLQLLEYGKDNVDDYVLIAEKQLAKAYLEAYKQVVADLEIFMAKFSDLPEAQKYNRLGNLKSEIADAFRSVTGKSIETCGDTSFESFTGAYESTWFSIEKSTELDLSFGGLNKSVIKASVYSQYSGADFKTRFGKLYTSTVDKVAESITRGLATGQGYAKTAREIKDIFDSSFYNALRVIRTESTRNFTEGSLEAYDRAEKKGIEGVKTWIASFDGRTRDSHARLNGQEADKQGFFKIDGEKALGPGLWGVAAQDINCRCTTYYKLKGYEKDYAPDWKYATWKANFSEWKKKAPVIK